ncbi:hypothetical protein OF83DRAFT_394532 [Amylostereum chailletii]|nr:hypothetical protein OF83DRAFT_394532 [Amylostereum chailletii]
MSQDTVLDTELPSSNRKHCRASGSRLESGSYRRLHFGESSVWCGRRRHVLLHSPMPTAYAQVCRRLQTICYILALRASGIQDGQHSAIHPNERARQLEDYNAAWRTVHWSKEHLAIVPASNRSTCLTSGGIVIGRTCTLTNPQRLSVVSKPVFRMLAWTEWEPEKDVWIDPSQDLLIVIPRE